MSIMSEIGKLLKIYYNLTPKELTEHRLIERYYDKVSPSLRQRYAELEHLGLTRTTFQDQVKHLIYSNNSFLAQIPKANGWTGKHFPVPFGKKGT